MAKKPKKKLLTRKRYRDKKGRFARLDRRKKLTLEIFSVKTGKTIRIRKLKPGKIKKVLAPKKIRKVPEELVFCVSDLPEEIWKDWQQYPGFEMFYPLRELPEMKTERYELQFMCSTDEKELETPREFRPLGKKRKKTSLPIHGHYTWDEFKKQCSDLRKEIIYQLNDKYGGDWSIDFVYAYNPEHIKKAGKNYAEKFPERGKA